MLTLYHVLGSRGLRPLWLIEEMALDCELVMLPFPPRSAARHYLQVNPLGTVPALLVGETVMTESCAILQFLATRFGRSPFDVVMDDPDYAAFLDFLHHADATLTFPQTVYMRFKMLEPGLGLQKAGEAYGDWFRARLAKVDLRLADRTYLCADRFTAADIAIGYALFLAQRIGLAHHLTPRLVLYIGQLMQRPAFVRARQREHRAAVDAGISMPAS